MKKRPCVATIIVVDCSLRYGAAAVERKAGQAKETNLSRVKEWRDQRSRGQKRIPMLGASWVMGRWGK